MALLEVGRFDVVAHDRAEENRTLITLCPSPSTTSMLRSQNFHDVRLWPRGVDLSQFGPSRRSSRLRASWGVGDAPRAKVPVTKQPVDIGLHWQGRKASMPMTPPLTPEVYAQGSGGHAAQTIEEPETLHLDERVVLLYVGRM